MQLAPPSTAGLDRKPRRGFCRELEFSFPPLRAAIPRAGLHFPGGAAVTSQRFAKQNGGGRLRWGLAPSVAARPWGVLLCFPPLAGRRVQGRRWGGAVGAERVRCSDGAGRRAGLLLPGV